MLNLRKIYKIEKEEVKNFEKWKILQEMKGKNRRMCIEIL